MIPHSNTPQGRLHLVMAVVLALGVFSFIANATYGQNSKTIPFSAQWWKARGVSSQAKNIPALVPGYGQPGYKFPPGYSKPGYTPGYGNPGYNSGTPGYVGTTPGYVNVGQTIASAQVCQARVACSSNQYWICSQTVTSPSNLKPGDIVKGSRDSLYYIAKNGKRYVFPYEKVYLTWYGNNGTCPMIKQVTDDVLTKISIGGNVTYHSGVRAIKIASDPKIYLPAGFGSLKLLPTSAAQTLWGSNWRSYVDDAPEAFFTNYQLSSPISSNETLANLKAYQTYDATIDVQLGL